MISPDVVDAVAAEKIEVRAPLAIVQIRSLRACVDLVKTDDPLDGDQGGIEVPLVELVVFAEAGLDEVLEIEGHEVAGMLSALPASSNRPHAGVPPAFAEKGFDRFRRKV